MAASTVVDPALRDTLLRISPGSTGYELEGARWGMLLMPPATAMPAKPHGKDPLRIVLFGSFWIGHAALRAALAYQDRGPGEAILAGVVTDDPLSPQARISLKKRAWGLMTPEERVRVKLGLVRTAIDAAVPVYTGEIKTPGFRQLLAAWQPHAIITCGFGQVLDRSILELLPYGAYNCHPTDLANGHGAGPAPWDDMTARGVHHTRWSVHQMTEVVDAGPVIGQTPPINVGDARGRLPSDNRAFFYKVVPPVGWMVLRIVDALSQLHQEGLPGPLTELDLDRSMPPGLRRRIEAPIARDWQDATIPEPGAEEFAALRRPALAPAASFEAVAAA